MPKFLSSIDLSNLELQNFRVQNLPSGTIVGLSDIAGQLVYDSSNNYLNWNDGTQWNVIYKASSSSIANTLVLRDGSGNHSATTLETSRNFSITGKAIAGSISFDGSGNVSLNVTALSVASSEVSIANGKFLIGDSNGDAEEVSKSNIPLSGFGDAEANVSMGGYKITSVATPTASADAATKAYVDSTSSGLSVKDSVKYATTGALTYSTYSYPSSNAVGAKMISAPGATLTVDSSNPSIGDRVLVKNETNADRNGIYERTADDGTSWVLTRTTDFDEDSEVSEGDFVFVTDGSTNSTTGWVLSTFNGTLSVALVTGDDLVFTQFSGAGTYAAGNGIVVDGTDIHFAKSSNYAVGDLFYADSISSVNALASVATGNVLISSGVSTAPEWGKVGLTTHVNGTLSATNGGTNISSYTAGDILYAISSDTLSKLTLGSDNEVLKVLSGEPVWGSVAFDEVTGVLGSTQFPQLSGDVSNNEGSTLITVEKITRQAIQNGSNLPDFEGLQSFFYTEGSSAYPDGYEYGGGIYFSRLSTEGTGRRGSWQMVSKMADEVKFYIRKVINSATNEWSSWYEIWHSGNDGPSSGLDSDKLDNQHGSYYLDLDNATSLLSVTNGGTNISSYTTGDIIYASNSTTLSKLTAVATGNVLISGGISAAPSWGKVGLATHVEGILSTSNGGIGSDASSLTAGTILVAKGDGDFNFIPSGSSGTYLKSQGEANPAWVTPSVNEFSGTLSNSQLPSLTGDVSSLDGSNSITVNKISNTDINDASTLPDFTGLKALFYTTPSTGYPNEYEYGEGIYVSRLGEEGTGRRGSWQMVSKMADEEQIYFRKVVNSTTNEWSDWRKIWHEGNDGIGSNLNADKLDDQDGSYYRDATNITGVLQSENGGTENEYFKVSGPASSEKTYTFKNSNSTIPSFYTDTITKDGLNTTYTVTHNLGTRNIVANVIDGSSNEIVYPTVEFDTTNTVKIKFGTATDSGDSYNIALIGY